MPGLAAGDFLRDLIPPIARDGAAMVEVQHILQSILRDLSLGQPAAFASAAKMQSRAALARAEAVLTLEAEKEELRALADQVPDHASGSGRSEPGAQPDPCPV